MNCEVESHGEKTLVTLLENRLDAALAVRFKDSLKSIVDDGADFMVLDLQQVAFMDSSGLGALVGHMKYMGSDKTFEICGLSPTVEKVFKLTRMDSIFTIHETREHAISQASELAG